MAPRTSILETITFFIEEPYFEATWKKVALALYHNHEEMALDKLFYYMKSPTGKSILQLMYPFFVVEIFTDSIRGLKFSFLNINQQ